MSIRNYFTCNIYDVMVDFFQESMKVFLIGNVFNEHKVNTSLVAKIVV